MLGHRELTMEDYADILKRRFWLILAFAITFLGVGTGISFVIPPQFVSQTLVLIEQQKVPTDYVTPVVTEDLGERLASMKEQILSRSRIQPIVERFNLYGGPKTTMDDRIATTQRAIGVKAIPSSQSSHGMPGFFITFKAQDARTAQQVCDEITSLFVSENLSAREQSAEGTTEFLKQQLDDSKRNLDEQDAKFAAFQQKYFGSLPEQESSNANTLQALTTQLDASTQSLGRMQQNETFIQTLIAQQTRDLQHNDPVAGISVDERRNELKALLAKKQELETLYTPDHPDVVAISRQISDLKAEIARASAETAQTPSPTTAGRADPPQLVQLKAQLSAIQQAMAAAKQAQAGIEQKIRTYESRIESSPKVEEEYKEITRDHDTALKFYNSLLTKMNESSMATALEHRQQGEQFRVMDAANLPDSPAFPNRFVFAGGGLAAGLLFGLVISALLEYRDTSLRTESDIWAFTKLPTLAMLSHIDGLPKPASDQKRRWKLFAWMHRSVESAGD
jgi:polysaccharide chain length determinant protein (PEP-CTERM system associated)